MGLINPIPIEARTWVDTELANASKLNTLRDDLRKLRPIGVAHYTTVNGVFVNTSGVQQAIDDAIESGALRDSFLYFPSGTWIIDDFLELTGAVGFKIVGDGLSTILSWVGPGGSGSNPLLYLRGCRNCYLGFMRLEVNEATDAFGIDAMIIQEQDGIPGSGVSTQNTYAHLLMEGREGLMQRGIYLKGDDTDANNDFSTFDTVGIFGYSECAVELQGANCMHNVFNNSQLNGQRVGKYGIKATVGAGGESGMFTMFGGACLSHLSADFYVQNIANGGYALYHVRSEGSNALWEQGTTGSLCPITFDNVRYSNDQRTGDLPVIKLGTPGPIRMNNVVLGTDYDDDLRILWQYVGGFFAPSFEFRGGRIYNTETDFAEVFQTARPTVMADSFIQHSDTEATPLFRLVIPNDKPLESRNFDDTLDLDLVRLDPDDRIIVGADDAIGLLLKGSNLHDLAVDCGIRFPATQVASSDANTLDDYEEGSFNPNVDASGHTLTSDTNGWYVKIGRLCLASGRIAFSALGTLTSGQLTITNLPFVADNLSGQRWPVVFGLWQNVAAHVVGLNAVLTASSTVFNVLRTKDTVGTATNPTDGTGGTVANLVTADLTNTSDLSFTIMYRTLN